MKKITALALAAVMLIALCPSASADGAEDYIALTGGVSMEMMSADYWLSKKNKQATHKDKVLMSTDEIAEFNRGCSAMISCGGTEFSLADIPDSLSGEIVRGFISSAAAPEDPVSKYLWGQPTNEEYWAALEQNRNLDAVPCEEHLVHGLRLNVFFRKLLQHLFAQHPCGRVLIKVCLLQIIAIFASQVTRCAHRLEHHIKGPCKRIYCVHNVTVGF